MRLTIRMWRALLSRLPDTPGGTWAWVRLKEDGLRGKRHYKHLIDLDQREQEAVQYVLDNPPDDYMRFVINHDKP